MSTDFKSYRFFLDYCVEGGRFQSPLTYIVFVFSTYPDSYILCLTCCSITISLPRIFLSFVLLFTNMVATLTLHKNLS